MKRIMAILAAVASIPLLVLGILFLIVAATGPSRMLVATVFLLVAGLLLFWSDSTLRRLAETSPQALNTGIKHLARTLGGEVTVAQVQAEFHIPQKMALGALEKMLGQGECQREQRAERDVYIFKSVMPAKVLKRCPYCGSQFPVKAALAKCPNCGASLETTKE